MVSLLPDVHDPYWSSSLLFVVLPSYLASPSDLLARAKDVAMGEGFVCVDLTNPQSVLGPMHLFRGLPSRFTCDTCV